MKRYRIFSIILLLTILIIPFIGMSTMVTAQDKPRYVGVNEGQVIIWNTEFDEDPLENWLEDRYGEGYSDDLMALRFEEIWDSLEYDDDVVAWRITINDIGKEKDMDYDGEHFNDYEADYVKLKISIYETEDKSDPNGWEPIDRSESFIIYDDEEEIYADFLREGADEFKLGSIANAPGMGLYYYSPSGNYNEDLLAFIQGGPYPMQPEWPMFFIPKGLDFDEIVDEVDEHIEGEIPAIDNYYSVSTEDVNQFFQNKEVGLESNLEFIPTSYTYVSKPEDFDSTIKFTDDGIMYYYEWSYDGDTIAKFELDTIGGIYLIENWWWIALIAAGIVILVIVIVILIKIKRK
ncbi:MAG: hypothetical protein ACFFAH_13425 [Promethearchaeota archaeon]